MGSRFPDDPDSRTKLDVAKDCLLHVSKQLGPRDRLSVITFNTSTKVVLPTDYCTPRHVKKQVFPLCLVRRQIGKSIGRTCLNAAYSDIFAMQAVKGSRQCARQRRHKSFPWNPGGLRRVAQLGTGVAAVARHIPDRHGERSRRRSACHSRYTLKYQDQVTTRKQRLTRLPVAKEQAKGIHNPQSAQFLPPHSHSSPPPASSGDGKRKSTESGSTPAEKKRAKVAPLSPCHLSIVGIGVDLSVRTVQAVSSIPGAKYCSVLSCNEFISSVAQEFTYDVLPIAFDINFSLSHGVSFQKIFGSSELNGITYPARQGSLAFVHGVLSNMTSLICLLQPQFPLNFPAQ
jgi:hypothetical protein